MYKQLMTGLVLIKEKYIYLLLIVMSLLLAALSFMNQQVPIERNQDTIISMSFAETAALVTFFLLLTLFFTKQHNITRYKVSEWYYIQPSSLKSLILGDLLFIIITHLLSYIYWIVFNLVNQTPEKTNMLLMVIAVSLMLHSIYLFMIYKGHNHFNTIYSIIYTVILLITLGFHAFIMRNDLEMSLNLSRMAGWNFYLYQLPYLTLAASIVLLIGAYFLARHQFNKRHHLA
ncbi:hypothetical protein ERX27_05150 [Macrococcus brunensis]|uniref:Uncharacterized protein n=1 Tax=Macrococcus brunensis TaxID=198483 RepID=A0A4R6BE77_9STAP|nr:hypothetical protein [Macrococcus brunensis]TDL98065.1 hypothetical protein ERX27_05150 [Macrococcus brunensis]